MSGAAADRSLTFRLRLPCPPPGDAIWGDYYFGRSLADALERHGHRVVFQYAEPQTRLMRLRRALSFRAADARADVDVVLRGKVARRRVAGRPTLMWLISNSASVTADEIAATDHIFVASSAHARQLGESHGDKISVLLQCTDATLFSPDRGRADLRTECLFVGNRREFDRRSVTFALRAGLPLTVWGRHWSGKIPQDKIAGAHIANDQLGAHYASAALVLNDHAPDMFSDGFTSNRVFDVLASGVPLVTDRAEDLPDDIAPLVYPFDDYDSFVAACAAALGEAPERRAARRRAAESIRQNHSFDQRAAIIAARARTLVASRRSAA